MGGFMSGGMGIMTGSTGSACGTGFGYSTASGYSTGYGYGCDTTGFGYCGDQMVTGCDSGFYGTSAVACNDTCVDQGVCVPSSPCVEDQQVVAFAAEAAQMIDAGVAFEDLSIDQQRALYEVSRQHGDERHHKGHEKDLQPRFSPLADGPIPPGFKNAELFA
jgi:hypothetical protein